MYLAYWGLEQSPFRGHLDPRLFYQGPSQDEALARLHFLVDERRTLGLVLGEPGSGKSLVLEVFARELGRVERAAAPWSVYWEWNAANSCGSSRANWASSWRGRAATSRCVARSKIICWPIAISRSPRCYCWTTPTKRRAKCSTKCYGSPSSIKRTTPGSRWSSRPGPIDSLRSAAAFWSWPNCAWIWKAGTWTTPRRSSSSRWPTRAARRRSFRPRPCSRLHELSGGLPRRIKQLADLALLGGAGANATQIEPPLIEAAYQELGVTTALSPHTAAAR